MLIRFSMVSMHEFECITCRYSYDVETVTVHQLLNAMCPQKLFVDNEASAIGKDFHAIALFHIASYSQVPGISFGTCAASWRGEATDAFGAYLDFVSC